MHIKVDPDYQKALQDFKWPKAPQPNPCPLNSSQLENVVREISKVIFASSHIRHSTYAASGIALLLSEVIINLKHGQDVNNCCLRQIKSATSELKTGLWHTFQILLKNHKQIDEADLKCATLFFGISQIKKIIKDNRKLTLQNQAAIEASETTLKNLILYKRTMSFIEFPEREKCLSELNEKIAACAAKIALLKIPKTYQY